MEKYLSAAGRIAERAIAAGRCRSRSRSSTACASRTCAGSIRATSRRRTASTSTPTTSCAIGLPGQRAKDASRSRSACGWTASWPTRQPVETKPSGLVYFNPYSEEQIRVPCPKAITRSGSASSTTRSSRRSRRRTSTRTRSTSGSARSPSSGRSRPTDEKPSRKKILVCDPKTGAGVRRQDPVARWRAARIAGR